MNMILFESSARDNYYLVTKQIYLDILGFIAPEAAFYNYWFCTTVRITKQCGNFTVFHPQFQLLIIFLGDLTAAWSKKQGDQQC